MIIKTKKKRLTKCNITNKLFPPKLILFVIFLYIKFFSANDDDNIKDNNNNDDTKCNIDEKSEFIKKVKSSLTKLDKIDKPKAGENITTKEVAASGAVCEF